MYQRYLSRLICDAWRDTPVVLVHGPRQAGKSTLVRQLADGPLRAGYVTLDDSVNWSAAAHDPAGFLRRFTGPVAIDEAQRVPELLTAIKAEVDRDRRPGRFLLTGSANALTMPRVSESLAGRMEVHRLWPLSQAELRGAGPDASFIDLVFGGRVPMTEGRLTRSDLLESALAGGFPEPLGRPLARRRQAWFANYLDAVAERDIRDLARIEGLTDIPRILQALAARSAALFSRSGAARDTGLSERTLGRYLALLQSVFLVDFLPAWSRNVTKRLAKAPKVLLTDTGLMGHLLRVDSVAQAERDAGALLETFVAMELRKQAGWSSTLVDLYHYRTHAGREVDLVLQHGSGSLVAIEVKCAATVTIQDFAGIRDLAEAVGDVLTCGLVLHTGRTPAQFGERLWAIPVEALWRSG